MSQIPGITPGLLSTLRGQFEANRLSQSAQVLRSESTQSATYATVDSFVPHGGAIPCRVRSAKQQREVIVADEVQSQVDLEVVLPFGTDVNATDRLLVDGAVTYEVMGTDAGRGMGICLIASVVQIGQ